jgi:hypothetical protein
MTALSLTQQSAPRLALNRELTIVRELLTQTADRLGRLELRLRRAGPDETADRLATLAREVRDARSDLRVTANGIPAAAASRDAERLAELDDELDACRDLAERWRSDLKGVWDEARRRGLGSVACLASVAEANLREVASRLDDAARHLLDVHDAEDVA